MTLLHASIPGEPVGKGRPRVTMAGGFASAYTPKRTATWEGNAAVLLNDAWGHRAPLEDTPVALHVLAVASRPKRLLRRKDPEGRVWRTTKPDGDNVLKCVADALVEAGVLRDDVLIVQWTLESLYARRDEGASVQLWLTPVAEVPAP